jgi:predicted PurR-regulated permease PerM
MLGIDKRALRIAWTVFLLALLLGLAYYIRDTLLVFAAAIFLAYMLSPIVSLVERFVLKRRGLALGVVYILLIGALVGLGFALIPRLATEATSLATRLPALLTSGKLAKVPLPTWAEPVREQVMDALRRQASGLAASVVPFIQRASTEILSGVGYLLPIILVPILTFFFLKDAREIRATLLGAFDADHRATAESIFEDIHVVLRNYLRTLVILAAASFAAWAIFLSAMDEPYDLLLAGTAGALEFIPVVGPAAALVIILLVCGVAGGGLIWIIVFWALYRIFQDYVLNPFLMSAGIQLHPLLVLFGVLAGEKIGGIPGMFFSIPALAILKVVLAHLRTASAARQFAEVRPDRPSRG